jgi:hypothetical protein
VASLLPAPPARAGEFHAVIMNFGNAPRAKAHLDVSTDAAPLSGGPVDVLSRSAAEDANTHLVPRSDADVIVQLVVDDGRLEALTVLPAVGG